MHQGFDQFVARTVLPVDEVLNQLIPMQQFHNLLEAVLYAGAVGRVFGHRVFSENGVRWDDSRIRKRQRIVAENRRSVVIPTRRTTGNLLNGHRLGSYDLANNASVRLMALRVPSYRGSGSWQAEQTTRR
jgi:hypothetical protein